MNNEQKTLILWDRVNHGQDAYKDYFEAFKDRDRLISEKKKVYAEKFENGLYCVKWVDYYSNPIPEYYIKNLIEDGWKTLN